MIGVGGPGSRRSPDLSLDSALRHLRRTMEPFGPADRATIKEVADAIGATQFIWRDAYVLDLPNEQVHIHPTMIVSKVAVPGAIRTDTYPRFPWRVELTCWTGRTSQTRSAHAPNALCQLCFNPIDERHADGCY